MVTYPRDPGVDTILPFVSKYVFSPIDIPTGTTAEIALKSRELVSFVRIFPEDSPEFESVEVSNDKELFWTISGDCPVTLEKSATRLTFPENGKIHGEEE